MLDVEGKNTLLGLRLLIARAAQKDSLGWWEDDSLTEAGHYLLERLFLVNPEEAGRKLALEAARTRYQAAFNRDAAALHLFHLDKTGEIEHRLQGICLADIQPPKEPLLTMDALRQKLFELAGHPLKFQIVGERANHRLEIRIHGASGKTPILDVAKTLAWASLEGKPGQPIFPYTTFIL